MRIEFAMALAMIALLTGLLCGSAGNENRFRNHAVEAGVAEYYLDEEHNKQFRFITDTEL